MGADVKAFKIQGVPSVPLKKVQGILKAAQLASDVILKDAQLFANHCFEAITTHITYISHI